MTIAQYRGSLVSEEAGAVTCSCGRMFVEHLQFRTHECAREVGKRIARLICTPRRRKEALDTAERVARHLGVALFDLRERKISQWEIALEFNYDHENGRVEEEFIVELHKRFHPAVVAVEW